MSKVSFRNCSDIEELTALQLAQSWAIERRTESAKPGASAAFDRLDIPDRLSVRAGGDLPDRRRYAAQVRLTLIAGSA